MLLVGNIRIGVNDACLFFLFSLLLLLLLLYRTKNDVHYDDDNKDSVHQPSTTTKKNIEIKCIDHSFNSINRIVSVNDDGHRHFEYGSIPTTTTTTTV